MRWMAVAAVMALASPAGSEEAHNSCLLILSQQLQAGGFNITGEVQEWDWRRRLEGAPEEAAAQVDEVIALLHERRAADRALADALLRLCASYPDD